MIENIDMVCRACSATNTIHVAHVMSQAGIVDRVCQIIIAAFAAIGTVVGLFKCRIDRKLNSPTLNVCFSDALPFYDVEAMSAPEGEIEAKSGDKKILLKVGVENVGPYVAKNCSIKLLSISLTNGNKELHLPSTDMRKNLKRIGNLEDGNSIQSGGMCLFELGEISTEKLSMNSNEPPAVASAACLELHCSDGTVERLRPHQSSVTIKVNLCADDFIPRTYSLRIDWKGQSVADIGTEGAFSCAVSPVKK